MICQGSIFFSSKWCMTGPMDVHSLCFYKDSTGNDEEPGKAMPRASAALAIVFAIYILCFCAWEGFVWADQDIWLTFLQALRPGQACHIVLYCSHSACRVLPSWRYLPYNWKADTMSSCGAPLHKFAWMEPLYTIKLGQFRYSTIIQFEIDINTSSNWTDRENRNTLMG